MNARLAIEGGRKIRTRPFPAWPYFWQEQKEAVQKVLDSGKVNYWTGSLGREFQARFAEFTCTSYAVAVNSGTAALHCALAAAQVGPGDEVIVPARTFIATAAAVVHQNAVPIFADVDPDTYTISIESANSLISPRTKAIIPVHLAGHPADMDPLMELAKEYGLIVIEDAAQAPGATYKGRPVGSLGHIAAFSFCQDKHFTTGGEGGAVVTNDEAMAEVARSIKDHGYYEYEHRDLLEAEALYTYIHHRIGWNYRLTEMQSALGITALQRMDWSVERRRENAHRLTEGITEIPWLEPAVEKDWAYHSFYKYYATIKAGALQVSRDDFVKAVRAEGVPIGLGSAPENYREEMFQKKIGYGQTQCPYECPWYKGRIDYNQVACPNARETGSRTFVLLVHPTADLSDMNDVLSALKKVGEAYSAL